MSKNNYSVGLVFIAIAIILMLGKMGVIGFLGSLFWPLFVLLPGVVLHALFFARVLPVGVLVPGGMLVTYSLLFFYCNIFGWGSMGYLWPGFIFGVAVGLYELHLYNRGNARGTLVAAFVLASISLVFFLFAILFSLSIYFIALILVAIGVVMMLRQKRIW